MAVLAAALEDLVDPAPKFLDPEDDNTETAARIVERFDEDAAITSEFSSLRQKSLSLLEDIDERYVGKRISRKVLDETQGAESQLSSDSLGSEDDAEFTEPFNSFKQRIREVTDLQDSDDLEVCELLETGSVSNGSEESNDMDSDNRGDGDVESETEGTENGIFEKFSNISVNEEIEKGKAVEAQLSLWNKFCECRIRFQKVLVAANKLPQFHSWNDFSKKSDESWSDAHASGLLALKSLMDRMLELQSCLWSSNPGMSFFAPSDLLPAQESHEDSGCKFQSRKTAVEKRNCSPQEGLNKRKLKLEEYGDILAKRFKASVSYRNSIIQKWDDKTRLTVGKTMHKSFNAFSQSTLHQIDQILQDKQRLIRRTQLKRSVYCILGKKEDNLFQSAANNEEEYIRDEHLNQYDPEIFDDDDFYHLLLKDIIENKTVGMDPDLLRTHMEIQKNRKKMKKKVDTKASKGRKLRYDPHPKMISFTAVAPYSMSYSEETRNDLFKRMFSQAPDILDCRL